MMEKMMMERMNSRVGYVSEYSVRNNVDENMII